MVVKKLSVFFPTFNEEGNVESTVKKALEVLEKLKLDDFEVIIVNDGSQDKTKEIAERLARENKKIKVINHQQNLGYGEALKSGFYIAKFDTIVYIDGDGQFDFSQVSKFLEKIGDYDLIIGYRIKRRDPFFRLLFAKGWKFSIFTFFGFALKDIDCGFKMIKKKVLEKIPHLESQRGAMINVELVIKAKKIGFKVGEVGVNHYPRLSGKPTGANIKVIVKSFLDLLRLWWKLKEQKGLFIILVLILLLASFLRFYRLGEYMTFLGDEGRDAIVVKNMLVDRHFPLIGPPTSVGNIYLGPLYYYMMVIPMAIFWLNPVAAAGMNVLIGVLTVLMIYYLGKIWFGRIAGLISSFLYAISPVTIIYSHSSWNPNPAPFFALIGFWGLYRLHKSGNFLYLFITGAAFAASAQMHYLALILTPLAFILWVYEILYRLFKKYPLKNPVLGSFLGVLTFFVIMSPLIWFDLRHNFLNYRAITELFTQSGNVRISPLANLLKIPTLYSDNLVSRYITGGDYYIGGFVSILILIPILFALIKFSKKNIFEWPILSLSLWMLGGLLILSFYQQEIFDHYLGFLNPTPYLLIGALVYTGKNLIPYKLVKFWIFTIILLTFTLTIINLGKSTLLNPPNNQLKRTQDIAKFIIDEANDQPFNFALLAKSNYDSAYQFYLDYYGKKPKQVPFDITNQLFVVCEDLNCQPINNPKYEIAGFGWAKIESQKDFKGVKIYKLIHNLEGKP